MIFKNKKGETLIEVIAALTSLVLAGLAAMTVILSAMGSTAISKEYLMAQNFAREGVEGVVNIRDTNWLLYSSDKQNCWDLIRSTQNDGTLFTNCSIQTKMSAAGNYVLATDTQGKLYLESRDPPVSSNNSLFGIVYGIVPSSASNLYSQNSASFITPAEIQPTPKFYRAITFIKKDADTYQVTVTVLWKNKSTENKYELTSIMTNYEK